MKGAAKNGPSCLQNIQAMEKQVRGGSQPASRGAPPPRARPLSLRGEKETPNAVLSLSRDSRALAHALSPPPRRRRAQRADRRKAMEDRKAERAAEEQRNAALGQAGSDVDFTRMIREYRAAHAHTEREHAPPGASNIIICVRKRPISRR